MYVCHSYLPAPLLLTSITCPQSQCIYCNYYSFDNTVSDRRGIDRDRSIVTSVIMTHCTLRSSDALVP